jgi:hypothetical protein
MADFKYSNRIITETKPLSPELKEKLEAERAKRKSSIKQTRLMSVDDEILKDFFYADCNWLWEGATEDKAYYGWEERFTKPTIHYKEPTTTTTSTVE